MANSSRPRRKIHRRSLDYNEGLLHEEELAIRRALQASLLNTKLSSEDICTDKEGNISNLQDKDDINHKNNLQHNNNHVLEHKEKKPKKKRLKEKQENDDSVKDKPTNTRTPKKQKFHKVESNISRSRSSSLNSCSTTDSLNSSSSNSKVSAKTVNSAGSQTKIKNSKMIHSAKSPKKEKLAVKMRKTLLKKKLKEAKMGSDCESTVSGSTLAEAVTTAKKTRRSRKRKSNTPCVQKKFASFTPSPTKKNMTTVEIDTSKPLAKAEDFIDFLCLRGHPLMPKDLDIFNNPYQSSVCEEDFPSSPPSSLLSELPSSPSPSLPAQYSVDSPSCDTPTSDIQTAFEDGLHAMRMYAGIENRRKELEGDGTQAEITIADLESEEEPYKNNLSVTPPLSFRVSPRPAPHLSQGVGSSTSVPKVIPSPSPQMTMSPSSGLDSHDKRTHYPAQETPSFGPPPLMLSQRRTSGSGGCCSPPPLLYIPAAAQRVTHLHGPPKLERVRTIPSDSFLKDCLPILTRHNQRSVEVNVAHGENEIGTLKKGSENRNYEKSNFLKNGDPKLNPEVHPQTARSSTRSSTEDLSTDSRTSISYTRDTQSCPLLYASDIRRIEQARKDLNNEPSYLSGVPLTRPSSQGANTGVISTQVEYNSRNHGPCSVPPREMESLPQRKASSLDLTTVGSPDSTVSLGATSLLENLQRAHDRLSSSSPSKSNSDLPFVAGNNKPSPKKLRGFLNSPRRPASETSSRMLTPSDSSDERSSPLGCDSFSALIRDRPTYSPPSAGSEPLQARQTAISFPIEGNKHEVLNPPWSHMQASYPSSATPPRPYTLSVDDHTSTFDRRPIGIHNQQRVVPRTIPLLPSNQVPLMPRNKHVSIPFNGGFLRSQHNLPSAFEGSSPRKDKGSGGTCGILGNGKVELGSSPPTGASGSILMETRQTALNNDSLSDPLVSRSLLSSANVESNTNTTRLEIARGSTSSCGESTSQDSNNDSNYGIPSVGITEKSHHRNAPRDINHPIATAEGSGKMTKTSNLNSPGHHDKNEGNSDVKKRRGRPPGSKNKKPKAENMANKVNSGNSSSKDEANDVKEKNDSDTKSTPKKKKIECPILRPTDEEFKDPLGYLKSVRSTLEKFGICIIDPPESWKLESHLPGNPRFTTKRQLIHRLQKRWGPTEIKLAAIEKHLKQQQSTFNLTHMPVVGGCDLDLAEVSKIVMEHGGMQKVIDNKKWNKVADMLKIPKSTQDRIGKVQDAYCKYLLSYDLLSESDKVTLEKQIEKEVNEKGDAEEYRNDCYLKGRSFSMACFQRTTKNFQEHFFKTDPSINEAEREYWKIVQSRDKYVAVHHVKLDSKQHGTCFPSSKTDPYTKNGWNLNVLAHLKGTILKHAGNVEDLTIPWLNIDMLFSTKRWTTTPLDTYLIDFLHSSNDKVWYGVPESNIDKFPHTKIHNTNDYEDGEFMVSPSNLSRETGINVTRLEQKQGQFVVIAPKVFHCSISSGYSVSETVSFAFPDWVLRTSSIDSEIFVKWPGFSYEKLLLKSIDEVSFENSLIVVTCMRL